MKGGGHEEIPVNMELLSNDNRVGMVLVVGGIMLGMAVGDWMGWGDFFSEEGWTGVLLRPLLLVIGTILALAAARRLLTPGCKPLLRINFGGITDVRLVNAPIRWSFIVDAQRPPGMLRYLLPGVVLKLHADYEPAGVETLWSGMLHLTCRLRGKHVLFLECGTLDHSPEVTLKAIQSHLRARQKRGARR
ncbi:MAG: hypothetical protein HQL99_15790 [Magnetococcales bacterium]|nr:hypothetical protein [Magnetococcales bacterium]